MFAFFKNKPSVIKNNKQKAQTAEKIKNCLYLIEKGQYDKTLDEEVVNSIIDKLSLKLDLLSSAVCTGKEDVFSKFRQIEKCLLEFNKAMKQSSTSIVSEKFADLSRAIDIACDIINGNISSDIETEKSSTKLHKKIAEIKEIGDMFNLESFRISEKIYNLDAQKKELQDKMIKETDERKIGEIYREINFVETKIQNLDVRKVEYDNCSRTIDFIYSNLVEMVELGKYNQSEIVKAKYLVNVDKVKSMIVSPDLALPILKVMEKELQTVKKNNERISASMENFVPKINEEEMMKALEMKKSLEAKKNNEMKVQEETVIIKEQNEVIEHNQEQAVEQEETEFTEVEEKTNNETEIEV